MNQATQDSGEGQTTVIVGAGHAGGIVATTLAQQGYAGRIILIGAESHLPYQRPPLSKKFLAGELAREKLFLKPQATYDKAGIDWRPDTEATAIDRQTARVTLTNGEQLHYDRLVLATGGRPRRLQVDGSDLSGVHYLRDIGDVEAMRPALTAGSKLVIVGGGYIGLEVAANAVKAGLDVTVLEAEDRVLARVCAPSLSEYYAGIHRSAGVTLKTDAKVVGFDGDTAVTGVRCADGSTIAADMVLVGIGIQPNVEIAEQAGLDVDDGILVDEYGRTSDPAIFAAGDCANHDNAIVGRRLRLESVPNAMGQARAVAATLCGQDKPYREVPWFWSDQYDLKLQMAGMSQGYDDTVTRGDMGANAFSVFYLRDGVVIAVDAVNRPQEFMAGKRLITERLQIPREQLGDESIEAKALGK